MYIASSQYLRVGESKIWYLVAVRSCMLRSMIGLIKNRSSLDVLNLTKKTH